MLNDELNLTVLEKGGRRFFKVKGEGGNAKLKPETNTPELRFKDSIAWSLKISCSSDFPVYICLSHLELKFVAVVCCLMA